MAVLLPKNAEVLPKILRFFEVQYYSNISDYTCLSTAMLLIDCPADQPCLDELKMSTFSGWRNPLQTSFILNCLSFAVKMTMG